ncbi:MAG: hypothetical protein ACRCU2_03450 [Planktothrix sp.]
MPGFIVMKGVILSGKGPIWLVSIPLPGFIVMKALAKSAPLS